MRKISRRLVLATPLLGYIVADSRPAHAARPKGALAAAIKAFDADNVRTIEYVGSGKWHLFGQ